MACFISALYPILQEDEVCYLLVYANHLSISYITLDSRLPFKEIMAIVKQVYPLFVAK